MGRLHLTVVVPAYNEQATIAGIVRNLNRHGTVLVVDDGSLDLTAGIAENAGAVVVSNNSNLGYDAALNTGFRAALDLDPDYILTFDADGQHPSEVIPNILSHFETGADVVIGVRDRIPRVSERVFAIVAERVWGIKDPLCGLKAYRTEVYKSLGHFDSYSSVGTELAIHAAKNGMVIKHVPLVTEERKDSPRFGASFAANLKVLRALLLSFIISRRHRGDLSN